LSDKIYRVIFDPECLTKLERFGTLEQLDPALSTVQHDLEIDPYAFKSSPKHPNWVVAITRRYYAREAGKHIPGLKLYAQIIEEDHMVVIRDVRINEDDPTLYM